MVNLVGLKEFPYEKPKAKVPSQMRDRLQQRLHIRRLRLQQGHHILLKAQESHFVWSCIRAGGSLAIQNRDIYTVADCSDFYTPGGFILSRESFWSKPSLKTALQPTNTTWKFLIPLFILYGAFHLSAWNAHFPTPIERWMWRGAGLAIVSIGALYPAWAAVSIVVAVALSVGILIVGIPIALFSRIPWFRLVLEKRRMALKPGVSKIFNMFKTLTITWLSPAASIIYAFLLILMVLAIYSLAFAGRGYFLIEAIISLRSPEAGTYNTTEWVNFLPHG
jgi:hypothetical protein